MNRSITVNGDSDGYTGFSMSSSNPIRYYVTHYDQGKIFIFDDEWNYISEKASFTNAAFIISVGNNFYITGDSNIWKIDEQLNKLIQYDSYPSYLGIYYSSSDNLIYVAPQNWQVIHIFDLDLRLIDSILTAPYNPWSINGYNNQLYVGTAYYGMILVIVNGIKLMRY